MSESVTSTTVDNVEVIRGNALDLPDYGVEAHLTVTSPPYFDAIDYDTHAAHGTAVDFRAPSGYDADYDAYLSHQEDIFDAVRDVTVDGGYCAVVVGHTQDDDGNHVPLPHHFANVMESAGWEFHERIIWNKMANGGAGRFGVTIQNPYSTYYYANQIHEEIQIWSNGEDRTVKDERSELEIDDLQKREVANNVWHIRPVRPQAWSDEHPCPFPAEIPYRLTKLYANPDETVLDPMAGICTTGVAARALDREAVCVDKREQYVDSGVERLRERDFEREDQFVPQYESVEPST